MKKIKVHSNIFEVGGFFRSILIDLQKEEFHFIPKEREDLINYSEIINNLYSKDIFVEEKKIFKKIIPINLKWYNPSIITNIQIINEKFDLQWKIIIDLINKLNVKNLSCSFNTHIPFAKLNQSTLESLEILLHENNIEIINKLANESLTTYIYVFNSEKIKYYELKKVRCIHFPNTFECINSFKQKNVNAFTVNISLFTESQKHNTYFNRKMCIDVDGNIKNAANLTKTFGNINDENLDIEKIVALPEFQKYWFVHKDLIDVCKHCEFRHMCVDSRVPIQRTDGTWFHDVECNYNPYICKWDNEEGYKTLTECGVQCNGAGFKINKRKLNNINKLLWED